MTIGELISIANSGGMVGLMALAIIALWQGWIVPRAVYRAQQRELRFWQQTAWVALGLAKQSAPDVPTFDFEERER